MSYARAGTGLPPVDERLVEPETPFEMVDGELVRVFPADPPHAERHLELCALLKTHTGAGFKAACDLLTRTTKIDDFAPDVSVYPRAPDPRTHGRQIEQLAFEVVSTQTLRKVSNKAAKLVRRGVRRVFAIDVKRSRALEWSAARKTWRVLEPSGQITDRALEVALPIAALIDSARTDDAMARALVARRNPVIEAVRAEDRATSRADGKIEGRIEGKIEGKIEALLAILAARQIDSGAAREQIAREGDPHQLDRWIARAATASTLSEVLDGP